jgi:hypothetical protein
MRWPQLLRRGATSRRAPNVADIRVVADPAAADGICEYLHCSLPALATVALVPSDELAAPGRISLCLYHHDKAETVDGMPEFLYRLADARRDPRERLAEHSAPGSLEQLDRRAYLDLATEQLTESKSFYGAYEGPSCFHPEWFFALQRDAATRQLVPSPGSAAMDAALGSLLQRTDAGERWLILRNASKYRAKIEAVLPDRRLVAMLRDQTLEAIDAFFETRPESARVASVDIGHLRIPYIFDECVITARRPASVEPVTDAIVSRDLGVVAFERSTFRQIFEASGRSDEDERATLVEFVRATADAVRAA